MLSGIFSDFKICTLKYFKFHVYFIFLSKIICYTGCHKIVIKYFKLNEEKSKDVAKKMIKFKFPLGVVNRTLQLKMARYQRRSLQNKR